MECNENLYAELIHAHTELEIIQDLLRGDCRVCRWRHDCSTEYGSAIGCNNGEKWEYKLFVDSKEDRT